MYKFNDKQRQSLLEDALVADLLRPTSSAQPDSRKMARRPAPAAAQPSGNAKAA